MEKRKRFYIIIFILIIWYMGSQLNLWSTFIIPSPEKVIKSFILLLKNGKLLKSVAISLERVILGFGITILIALPLGIIFGLKPKLYEYFKGIFEFLRHVPPLALIPMIILWFGIGELSKIIIIILASFFPVFLNSLKGIVSCDEKYIEVGKVFGLSTKRIFTKIILPSAIPDILLGLKLGLGYSWRAIIAAELIASSSGIGYLILDAQQISRSDIVVVGILSVGLLGIFTDYLFSIFINKYLKRRKGNLYERGI
ncbi:ABC transporter permease [uncultured Fusobacterium sp.]|uniref:ABC transporter permease n=1 Tax=uncultured Fusobacterium sp. TaxID=159267 RepID=UPI0025D6EDE3|nr:ABC transporter permease [uncultured Fusobacterium sp.]